MIHVCHEGCDHTGITCQFCGAEVGRDGVCRSCGWGEAVGGTCCCYNGNTSRCPIHQRIPPLARSQVPTPPTSTVTLDRELDKAVKRWVNAKREQILREDTRGELLAEVKRQESDVEDAIYEELAALKAGKEQ